MKKLLTTFYRAVWLLLLICSFRMSALAQSTVTGRVTSMEDNSALPGVTILQMGTTNGTITDVNGQYSLQVPGDAVLQFSSIGFTKEEISVNGRTTINVQLSTDIQALSEVVVVGYGSQEKRDITGSIASVSSQQITEVPVVSVDQALQGRVAGVDVVSQGSRPGQGVTIRIRGRRSILANNDPLFVLDGIPLAGGLEDIDPNDIESTEILKDASATAIYGSRGANGVVLITTKRGKEGKTQISYNAYYGIQNAINKVDMMNGAEFAELKRESRRTTGNYTTDEALFEPVELESIRLGRSTNYQDLIMGTGNQQSHHIGIYGGESKTKFAISGNYFNQEGITPGQAFQRFSIRINLDHQITDRLKVGASTLISRALTNWGSSPYDGALQENPLGVPYDEEGNLIFLPTTDGLRTNPLAEIQPNANLDDRKRARLFSSIYGEYKILEGLTYRLNFGPDQTSFKRGTFLASQTNSRRGGQPTASNENFEQFSYTLENILNYDKQLNEQHKLGVTLLHSIQRQRFENSGTSVLGLPYESQLYYNLGSASTITRVSSGLSEWSILSYMGRINYSLNDKYLFTFTTRADGSSRLAEGKKFGFFPSAAFGWRISEEGFMQSQNLISNAKLRASYGIIGNTGINPYQTQGSLSRTVYAFENTGAFGYRPQDLPNPNLKWETTAMLNVGLDFNVFKGRISASLDFYQANTTDLLMERQLPITSGYSNIIENIGATRNTGFELFMETVNIDRNNFRWKTSFNFFTNNEEIVELYGGTKDDVGNRWFIGKPLTVFYDYEKAGIWQTNEEDVAKSFGQKPGEIKITDQNNDGKINEEDRVILGSEVPDWSGGMSNSFKYKGLELSVFIFTRQGSLIRSAFHENHNYLFGRYNNLDVDYWTPDNPTNAYPRPNQNQERPVYNSSLAYFDGSFVKIRNISLSYTLPETLMERTFVNSLRFYATAQNPFIFTDYEGYDPESGFNAFQSPSVRTILLGINAKF